MHGRWFRFYDSVVDDPKVQRLSLSAFRFWVNVLCLASRNGGKLPPLVDLTFSLRMTEKQVVDGLKSLEAAGLVDESVDGVSTPHNWNGRQFKADVSTERVKRFRERSTKRDETVSRNAPETEQNTEAETEQKDTISKRKRTALPDIFPLQDDLDWADEHWISKGRADLCDQKPEQIRLFRDHHSANAKPSADWPASWRTWAQNAVKFNRKQANGKADSGSSHDKFLAGGLAALDKFKAA
jgi:hypothetical protein